MLRCLRKVTADVSSQTPTAPPGGTPVQILFGRYIIHRLIGMGGMAEIYRASVSGPAGFEKPVVIKRVRSQYAQNDTFVQMFVDEARICASLNHANLVTVFDFGQEDGHFFMAMELVDGLDLRTAHVSNVQATGKPLDWEVSTVVMRDALRGLDYAHKLAGPDGSPLGIVHRDIDLANIMVRRDGAVKVLDFGCAKASSAIRRTQTVAGVIKGKLGYMSPEQSEDQPLDGRSDVFAASIVLHELLTGRRLFFGDDPLAVIQSVRTRPIPDPRDKNPSVPENLVNVVMQGLARNLDERFESAGAMADALDSIIHEHRLSNARVAEAFAPLISAGDAALGKAITQDQRKLTLAAWSESTSDAEPMEIISGVLLDDDDSDVANAPFIDATIIVTNPRWMLSQEGAPQTEVGAANAVLAEAQAPAVTLNAEQTEILGDAPPVNLHAEQTALIGTGVIPAVPDNGLSAALSEALNEAPAVGLVDQETVMLTRDERKYMTGPLAPTDASLADASLADDPVPTPSHLPLYLLIAAVSLALGMILFWSLWS
jgi:serine/threonine protein kinase